jgi:hypothetical protein
LELVTVAERGLVIDVVTGGVQIVVHVEVEAAGGVHPEAQPGLEGAAGGLHAVDLGPGGVS